MAYAELKLLDILLSEGSLDILSYLKEKNTGQFKDFLKIKNKRTGKNFSPSTVSTRLDELESINAISTTTIKTPRRRVLDYQITKIGKKILETAYEFEKRLNEIIGR